MKRKEKRGEEVFKRNTYKNINTTLHKIKVLRNKV